MAHATAQREEREDCGMGRNLTAVVLSDPEGREQLGQRGIAALTSVVRKHTSDAGVVRSGMHACRASMLVRDHTSIQGVQLRRTKQDMVAEHSQTVQQCLVLLPM